MIELDKIYNTDCLEGLRQLPDKCVDLVVTDPPYLLETSGAGIFGKKSDDYAKKRLLVNKKWYTNGERYVMKNIDGMKQGISNEYLDELCRVMKKINIYLFCSQKQIIQYLDYFANGLGCNWNLITWHKDNVIPSCGNKYLTDTEYCLFFREKGVRVFGNYDTKRTYYVTHTNKKDKDLYGHPTIKPLEIIRNLIINSSEVGGAILDPFMGSGTTAVAAKQLNRHFIGYEINETYYNTALRRIEEQQLDLFDKQ